MATEKPSFLQFFQLQNEAQNIFCRQLHLAQGDAALFPVGGKQCAVGGPLLVDEGPGAGHQHIYPGTDPVGVALQLGEFGTGGILHPPVGDHAAVKAPFVPEDGFHQLVMVVAPDTVDQIVAGHDGLGIGFLDADLEALQIDLPEGTLGEDTVILVPIGLLVVAGEVLGAGSGTDGLDAPDEGGGDPAGEQGIFGEVFKIPAAEDIAVDIHTGSQQNITAAGDHFLCHMIAEVFDQCGVKGAGQSSADGQQGAGIIEPDAGGAVGGGDDGDALVPEGLGDAAENTGIALYPD